MAILGNYEENFETIFNNIGQLSTISTVILANFKDNYGTATTTANKSMGFDSSATQSCSSCKCNSHISIYQY